MPKDIKTPGEFVLDAPLYAALQFDLSEDSADPILPLFYEELKFDGHCPECHQPTVYLRSKKPFNRYGAGGISPDGLRFQGYLTTAVQCARDASHYVRIWFSATDDAIQKVGQYPSLADIANDEARIYDKQLSDIDRRELHRAIGLAAHDIGVGSFAYLRRVFERLLRRTFDQHREGAGWTEEQWSGSRVDQRIQLMKDWLPEFINDCPPLYGVLSKGLHELTEEECQVCFPVLKSAVLEILEDEKRVKEKAAHRKATSTALSQLKQKLGQ